jgi:IS5 family transposase
MKRRAAVEPSIGHLKAEHRLERNRLKGVAGDALNAILSAAAMNFHKLLGAFWRVFLLCLMRTWDWIPALQQRLLLQTQSANA